MLTTANSPASAHLLDVTRTVSRARRHPTGIDRIERAYIANLAQHETPLYGLVRTKLGFLLLDKEGCKSLLRHCKNPSWQDHDVLSRLTRRSDPILAATETGLRNIAVDRATPTKLGKMLARHLPKGTVYFNTGQTNFGNRVIQAINACEDTRIVTYVHDTIPLDLPSTQTQKSQQNFKRFFDNVDHHSDLVLCNSTHTKTRILTHAQSLTDHVVHVAYPGLPEMEVGTAPLGPWTDKPYFVAIGTIEPRKNISLLLDIWAEFSSCGSPHLLLCGRRGWLNEDVFERLDQNPDNIHEVPNLTDGPMWALLNNSAGLLFPSVAEGFGYPAIEAAHLNVPLICNPLPVFKELLGDYPIYADEPDRYIWRNNIEQLAQRRRDQSGEQYRSGAFTAPSWQAHFNQLFTFL